MITLCHARDLYYKSQITLGSDADSFWWLYSWKCCSKSASDKQKFGGCFAAAIPQIQPSERISIRPALGIFFCCELNSMYLHASLLEAKEMWHVTQQQHVSCPAVSPSLDKTTGRKIITTLLTFSFSFPDISAFWAIMSEIAIRREILIKCEFETNVFNLLWVIQEI